ncbi:MAG: HAD family hydrolase [Phycisphaeraceae bacterium]|nr:HAD family hydrolase [Phycisphaeraceae bacterium]
MMHPAVFLDRDNTLIHNDGDMGDPRKVILMQGAAAAVASLCGLGYKVIVVSNQGGVARGNFGEDDVRAVNQRLSQLLQQAANGARIDAYYYCPYHPDGKVAKYKREHPNRKPQPGMWLEAAEQHDLDLSRSWTIGDQPRDVQAGAAAGTRTILLREDADLLAPLDLAKLERAHNEAPADSPRWPNYYARTLIEAVRIIAQQRNPESEQTITRAMAGERKWDAAAVAQLQKPAPPRPAPQNPAIPPRATKPFQPWDTPPLERAKADGGGQRADSGGQKAEEPKQDKQKKELDKSPRLQEPDTSRISHPPSATRHPPSDARLLRLILQELRAQRGSSDGEFNYLSITAIVLQLVAGVCLLGGLWMGAGDYDLFMRWMLSGLIVQGATIALLLFVHRR